MKRTATIACMLFLTHDVFAQSSLFQRAPGDPANGAVNPAPTEVAAVAEYPVSIDIRSVASATKTITVAQPDGTNRVFTQKFFDPLEGFVIDEEFDAVPDPKVPDEKLRYRWYGLDKTGQLLLSVGEGRVSGTMIVPGAIFSIVNDGEGKHTYRQSDPTRFPSELPVSAEVSDKRAVEYAPLPAPGAQKSLVTVDMLVLYTPAVLALAGSAEAVTSRVDEAIAQTNTSFTQGGAFHLRVRNVLESQTLRAEELNYPETNSQSCPFPTDPNDCRYYGHKVALRANATAQARRTATNADLVVMLVADTRSCGNSYVQSTNCGVNQQFGNDEPGCDVGTAYKPFAFGVVTWSCATAMQDFAHEVGHMFAMAHNPENFPHMPFFPWAFAHWSFNQQESVVSNRGRFGQCGTCTKALQFSNPDLPFVNFPATPSGTTGRFNARIGAHFAQTMSDYFLPDTTERVFWHGFEQLPCTSTGTDCHGL